ncbi:MAG: hypothetical protein AAB427_13995 [Chloroflexota bacterium]
MSAYEILWHNEHEKPHAYILVDVVEADSPEQALKNNLKKLTATVKRIYGMPSASDAIIQRSLFALRRKGLVSVYDIRKKQPKKRKLLKKA